MEGNLQEDGAMKTEVIIQDPEDREGIILGQVAKEGIILGQVAKEGIIQVPEDRENLIRDQEDREDSIRDQEVREDSIQDQEVREDIIQVPEVREDITRDQGHLGTKVIPLELQVDPVQQPGGTIMEDVLQLTDPEEAGATQQQLDQISVRRVNLDLTVIINLISGVQDQLSPNSFSECQQM